MDQLDYVEEERGFTDEMDGEDNGRNAGESADDYEMVCLLIPSQ